VKHQNILVLLFQTTLPLAPSTALMSTSQRVWSQSSKSTKVNFVNEDGKWDLCKPKEVSLIAIGFTLGILSTQEPTEMTDPNLSDTPYVSPPLRSSNPPSPLPRLWQQPKKKEALEGHLAPENFNPAKKPAPLKMEDIKFDIPSHRDSGHRHPFLDQVPAATIPS
jgi:hypothetical protein